MQLTFLGTSAGMPTKDRNVPAIALRFEQQSTWWLFDCGEGTQRQILGTSLSPAKLEHVFLTHLHGDHCLGLFGLLASRSLNKIVNPIHLHAPRGLAEMLDAVWSGTGTHLQFETRIEELVPAPIFLPEATITPVPVDHNIATYAFVIREPDRPGHFLLDQALACGIPAGPYYSLLKRGETITLPDGRVFHGEDFTQPAQRGRKIVLVADNRSPSLLLPHLTDADLLVHEATFTREMLRARKDESGEKYAHTTAAAVAEVAAKAGVPNLVLTHFSAGFSRGKNKPFSLDQVLAEAQRSYSGQCVVARDFTTVILERDGKMACRQFPPPSRQ